MLVPFLAYNVQRLTTKVVLLRWRCSIKLYHHIDLIFGNIFAFRSQVNWLLSCMFALNINCFPPCMQTYQLLNNNSQGGNRLYSHYPESGNDTMESHWGHENPSEEYKNEEGMTQWMKWTWKTWKCITK